MFSTPIPTLSSVYRGQNMHLEVVSEKDKSPCGGEDQTESLRSFLTESVNI